MGVQRGGLDPEAAGERRDRHADLACSLYLRGRKEAAGGGVVDESLTLDDKLARTRRNLDAFLDKVAA
ncbi:FBP domain-containing protein [Nonomuraea coxensis]|uniref:FBP domain-containing protein n=1 Tax=Nonomuraea coxensis TaxID=404386 RepID=UPI001C600546|nr:FBP domain-containing protein [Nonomuraea coxensis]